MVQCSCFNGATNNTTNGYWSYSVGMNGSSPGTATLANRLILQNENSSNFSTTSQTALKLSPVVEHNYVLFLRLLTAVVQLSYSTF